MPSTGSNPARSPLRRMDGTTLFFIALAIVTGALTAWLHGTDAFTDALGRALRLLVWITPVLLGALMLGAYVHRLIPRASMERWLGGRSGVRGMLIAASAGAITPGGPFAAFPLVVALYRAGASGPICVTYLTAWSVLGLNRALVWELPFLGPDFVLLRLAVSLPLPFLAGYLAALARWEVRPWQP